MSRREELSRALQACARTSSVDEILALTRHPEPRVRCARECCEWIRSVRALREICPCRVREDIDRFWERVFEMVHDDDADVRAQVLHTLCDGSPSHLEDRVLAAVGEFNREPVAETRRRAHKVLASYRRTGRWNIL